MATKLALITGYAKYPDFVKTLLHTLNNQTFKDFDCYVYASPGSLCYLSESFINALHFNCYHIKLAENAGFAGNNNFTINAAFKNKAYEYAVLANDDTIPEDNWLEELLQTAERDITIGAVAPKMVFYQKFVSVKGIISTPSLKETRPPGIRFYQNTGFAGSFYPKKFYTKGFSRQEEDEINPFRYTSDHFTVELPFLPAGTADHTLRLFISKDPALKDQVLTIVIGDILVAGISLQPDKICYEIKVPAALIENNAHYIIQNAGGGIRAGNTYETGFGEIDKGQYNTARDTSLFCGGACLLRKKALVETGLFMDGLFSYYEDSDLSIRLRKKGFRIAYNPGAVIKHYHTGTSKEWSPFFTYYAFRNKIIFSAKTFGIRAFIHAFIERSRETYRYFKLYAKSKFRNPDYKYRLKLNLVILKDALIGIVKFKPKFLTK